MIFPSRKNRLSFFPYFSLIYIGKVLTSIDSQQYPPFRTLTRLRCSLALSTTCLAVDILHPSLDKSPLSVRVLSFNKQFNSVETTQHLRKEECEATQRANSETKIILVEVDVAWTGLSVNRNEWKEGCKNFRGLGHKKQGSRFLSTTATSFLFAFDSILYLSTDRRTETD